MQVQQKNLVYQELVDLIANSDPKRVLAFRLSAKTSRRVETLVMREKENRLKLAEQDELNTYMQLSRILMLAQARAHKLLNGKRTSKKRKVYPSFQSSRRYLA